MRLGMGMLLVASAIGSCSDGSGASPALSDATVAAPDATTSSRDAPQASVSDAMVEDLDMTLEDFAHIPGFMTPTGKSYFVANPLGHETEALMAAESPTGGPYPVGSIVEAQPGEVMVKRRVGFDATTADWEFFSIQFASDGTPLAFGVRGTESTACFMCHQMVSSTKWDFICEHP